MSPGRSCANRPSASGGLSSAPIAYPYPVKSSWLWLRIGHAASWLDLDQQTSPSPERRDHLDHSADRSERDRTISVKVSNKISEFDVGIEAVNRGHTQLAPKSAVFLTKASVESAGASVSSAASWNLIVVRARDSVVGMSVCDQYIVGSQALSDGCDRCGIDDLFHEASMNFFSGH